ncbi:PLP-dependent aminotransferase family protein [Streptomyces sp. Je 1-79]|uniref:aminotransferase-like domain-containing protein n=1 Tax=Streptomyces sp. Je 1-79 TaxID=2943847 RepID=UPI0021A2C0F6|nr:PLP-dependent aminotransferase family protein [Streptomyces sp. Je 1-79]MCT4354770.1 PLP-dependent aminotransferase family protein [Streptomyces sp. Je 1-79]
MEEYRRIADRVAERIADGRLRPGDRLPPQRVFARRHGIAGSTAIRVYGELARRGLVVGEVGRGTFVRAAPPPPGAALALAEATGQAPVDLQLNYPVAEGQSELMARALGSLARADVLGAATSRPAAAAGTAEARAAAVRVLARPGWEPDPDRVLFAGNGRQAIAASLAALVPPGGALGVEELTYPLVKSVAERLGVRLVPIALDEEGMRPDALEAARRTGPLSAVYVQPTLHNPLSLTAGPRRRAELAAVLRESGLTAIEDTTWAFLVPDAPAPLAAHAPEHVVLVDSLSKRLAPGLTVGHLVAPEGRTEALARALRSGAWTAGGLALAAATRWAADGTVTEVVAAKRADAAARHALVLRHLGAYRIRTSPHAYYCWWELPAPWRSETFVAAAAERGIALTGGEAFAVGGRGGGAAFAGGGRGARDAVRVGLASPALPVLDDALRRLGALASEILDI